MNKVFLICWRNLDKIEIVCAHASRETASNKIDELILAAVKYKQILTAQDRFRQEFFFQYSAEREQIPSKPYMPTDDECNKWHEDINAWNQKYGAALQSALASAGFTRQLEEMRDVRYHYTKESLSIKELSIQE